MEFTPPIRDRFTSSPQPLQERLVGEQAEAWLAVGEPSEADLAWEETTFRRRILGICGFGPDDGLALALRPEIDLQDAIALVRRGCEPATAAQILL